MEWNSFDYTMANGVNVKRMMQNILSLKTVRQLVINFATKSLTVSDLVG